jgi:TPR repeat protein
MKKLGIALILISLAHFAIAQSEIDKLIAKGQAGDPKAQNQLGVRYLLGDGVEKDPNQAVGWYRKAARAGYADAIFNLGAAYFNGTSVTIDDSTAFAFFLAAADAGSSSAKDAVERMQTEISKDQVAEGYLLLGEMKSSGKDLPQDTKPPALRMKRRAICDRWP